MNGPSPAEKNPRALAFGYLYVVYGMLVVVTLSAGLAIPALSIPVGLVFAFIGQRLSVWFMTTMRKIEE